ncbi:hypothetical protein D3C78_985730 [compost metagenome]
MVMCISVCVFHISPAIQFGACEGLLKFPVVEVAALKALNVCATIRALVDVSIRSDVNISHGPLWIDADAVLAS